MNNRYCMLCGTLLPEDGVCLRCGTKYKLLDDGQMTIIPRRVKKVSAKVIPKKKVYARIVSGISESDTQPLPDLEDVYSFSEKEKPHVDWTDYSSEDSYVDDSYEPDFILVDEDEMDWDDDFEEASFSGEKYEPSFTRVDYDDYDDYEDYDDYDDDPVYDDIYRSKSSGGSSQGGYVSSKRVKKKHPFLNTMVLLLLCGGLLYLFKAGVFTPFTSSNNSPRTVSVRSTSRYTTSSQTTSTSQTTVVTTVEETTKGPEYVDVPMLSRIILDDYTIHASYDLSKKTLKTNNWEGYLAEDDAYNTCIQSRELYDTASSKANYLDYIIFFAPYNKNILNRTVQKVVEDDDGVIRNSDLALDGSGRLKAIKTYGNGVLVDSAEYEYTSSEIVIRHGGERFVMDQVQKPKQAISLNRDGNNKVTRYVIEVMEDLVTSEITYDNGRIKHVRIATKYYEDKPDENGITQTYSGVNYSNVDLNYSTYSIPIYE